MFRFTIRDVLWLTALVALGAGWWRERTNAAHERAERLQQTEIVKTLRKHNAKLMHVWKVATPSVSAESILNPPWVAEPTDSD